MALCLEIFPPPAVVPPGFKSLAFGTEQKLANDFVSQEPNFLDPLHCFPQGKKGACEQEIVPALQIEQHLDSGAVPLHVLAQANLESCGAPQAAGSLRLPGSGYSPVPLDN
mmetsp:Transcript_8754/g.11860  ORF Transcript_8754/g.11860 Transcript_8754/m.11860 type:complete len:111 (-) Transcript_8754:229-561(-)